MRDERPCINTTYPTTDKLHLLHLPHTHHHNQPRQRPLDHSRVIQGECVLQWQFLLHNATSHLALPHVTPWLTIACVAAPGIVADHSPHFSTSLDTSHAPLVIGDNKTASNLQSWTSTFTHIQSEPPHLHQHLRSPPHTRRLSKMSENNGSPGAEKPEEQQQQATEHLNIKVTDNNNEVFFKIKRSTQLKKLMDAFCDRQGKATASVRFLFDGQRVNPTDTPDTVGTLLATSV